MERITCPECGLEGTAADRTCPGCGHLRLAGGSRVEVRRREHRHGGRRALLVAVVVALALLVLGVLLYLEWSALPEAGPVGAIPAEGSPRPGALS